MSSITASKCSRGHPSHLGASLLGHQHRLPCEHGLVHRAPALQDLPIDGDALPREHPEEVARSYAGGWH